MKWQPTAAYETGKQLFWSEVICKSFCHHWYPMGIFLKILSGDDIQIEMMQSNFELS